MHSHTSFTLISITTQHQSKRVLGKCVERNQTQKKARRHDRSKSRGNKTSSLSFLVCNVDGLHRKIGDGDFKRYLEQFSIARLVETFVDNSYDLTKHFKGYDKYISPGIKFISHQCRRSGGVLLSVKRCFSKLIERTDTPYDQMIVVKLSQNTFQRNAWRYSNLCLCASTREPLL